jgi:hypothetical protein
MNKAIAVALGHLSRIEHQYEVLSGKSHRYFPDLNVAA